MAIIPVVQAIVYTGSELAAAANISVNLVSMTSLVSQSAYDLLMQLNLLIATLPPGANRTAMQAQLSTLQ